jgi:hypothetical protein
MRDRTEVLQPVDKPGHLCVELPGKGRHDFRLPTWSQSRRISEFAGVTVEGEGDAKRVVWARGDGGAFEYYALLVGASWRHQCLTIEAAYPVEDNSTAALIRYAEAVQQELEEEGYTFAEVVTLAGGILDALNERQREREEGEQLAGFSSPTSAGTTSS